MNGTEWSMGVDVTLIRLVQGCRVSEGGKVLRKSNVLVTRGPVCDLNSKRSLLDSLESGFAGGRATTAHSQSCAGHCAAPGRMTGAEIQT